MKNTIKTLILLTLAASCGHNGSDGNRGRRGAQGVGVPGAPGKDGVGCSVTTVTPCELAPAGGVLVTCGDTSSLLVNGVDGLKGDVGEIGESAYQIWLDLGNEGTITDYLTDLVGQKGDKGDTGNSGLNGKSAYQLWLDAGNLGTLADYLNSLKGTKGDNGNIGSTGLQGPVGLPSAYSIVQVLNPCGANGAMDEVLLRFQNGMVLASVSDKANGENTRLSLIKTGNYSTTDGFSCNFSIVVNNDGTGILNWIGGLLNW